MKYKIGQEVMTESEGKGTIEAIDDSQQIPLYFVYFPHLKNSPAKGYKVFNERQLRPYIPQKEIYITIQDDEVQSFLKEDGQIVNSATNKCHLKDEFDFEAEAKLAFERLFKEDFKPHLLWVHYLFGIIGTPTKMKDNRGQQLFVGDIVLVIEKDSGIIDTKIVCENDGKQFIMEIDDDIEDDGTINGWFVIKEKSYKDLYHKERVCNVIAILKED